jgi:hypothetical protein
MQNAKFRIAVAGEFYQIYSFLPQSQSGKMPTAVDFIDQL